MDFVKKYFKAILVITFLFVSVGVFNLNVPTTQAATEAELQALIAQLQAQIANLQKQLAEITGGEESWCHDFNMNLKYGNSGSEVRALQRALHEEEFAPLPYKEGDKNYGNFEQYTASAVVQFQEKYASDVLAPWGLEHGTGFVGSTTRQKLNEIYGCGIVPKICIPEGKTGYAYQNDICCAGLTEIQNTVPPLCLVPTNTSFICSYCGNGVCGLGENICNCSKDCKEKSISVLSPNGGEQWMKGNTYEIKWNCPDGAGVNMVDIFIKDNRVDGEWDTPIVSLVECSLEKYSWKIPEDISSGENCFKVELRHVAGSQPLIDASDNYFSIVEVGVNLPPVVDGLSAPTQLKVDEKGTWTIKVHDPENGQLTYNVNWGDENFIKPLSSSLKGTQSTSFTHSYSKTGNYTIKFTVTDDQGQTANTSTTVKVVSTTCHTTPLWDWDYCSSGCKCYAGEGDCDTDADCHTGYCAHNVGAKYGQVSSMDVCEEKQAITVLSPNGGEEWQLKSSHTIKWTSDRRDGLVDAYLEQLGKGGEFINVGKIIPMGKGSIQWDGEINDSGNYAQPGFYYIRLYDNKTKAEDRSNKAFHLVPYGTVKADINVNGSDGPITTDSRDVTVSWTSEKADTCYIVAASFNTIDVISMMDQPPSGSKKITLPGNTTGYNVNINCSSDIGYASDNVKVNIETTISSITVLSPNGPEEWFVGQSYDIKWNSTGVENVNINLVDERAGPSYTRIATLVSASLGKYSWTIPEDTNPGEGCYKIKIWGGIEPYPTTVSDTSDESFSIIERPKSIKLLSPNGGEEWTAGQTYDITWSSSSVDKIDIFLADDRAGRSYSQIALEVSASLGKYSWTIPDGLGLSSTHSPCFKIWIHEIAGKAGTEGITDESDNYFSIIDGGVGLFDVENQLASLADVIVQLAERLKELMK